MRQAARLLCVGTTEASGIWLSQIETDENLGLFDGGHDWINNRDRNSFADLLGEPSKRRTRKDDHISP